MKLIKKKEDWYNLYEGEIGIGSTYKELQGFKLSLKNCQAIELEYDLDELLKKEIANGKLHPNDGAKKEGIERGIQIALEIFGDKKFSKQDMINFSEFVSGKYINQYKFLRDKSLKGFFSTDEILKEYQSLQQTEWDVEIEMEYVGECNGNNDNGCFQDSPGHNCGCFERKPKLDDGYIILKRI